MGQAVRNTTEFADFAHFYQHIRHLFTDPDTLGAKRKKSSRPDIGKGGNRDE